MLGSGLLVFSAALAGYSARPIEFYPPGANFDDLKEDIETGEDFTTVVTQLGRFNDKHTRANDEALNRNARCLLLAFVFALLGILAAIVPQVVLDMSQQPQATQAEAKAVRSNITTAGQSSK